MKKRVLIVDDEKTLCRTLALGLSDMGFSVETEGDIKSAIKRVNHFHPHLVLSDLRLNNESGIDLLEQLKAIDCDIEIIIMTAYSDISSAVESIKKGAFDYINKPFELEEMGMLLNRAYDSCRLKNKLQILEKQSSASIDRIIYECEKMEDVMQNVQVLSDNDNVTVLIKGETGTGKEMIADAIHGLSIRKDFPIVRINCSTIPAQLVESELFGHERNAFTGADNRKKGLFEIANGGTVFLDELGELPLEAQAKLLRILEDRNIRRVGGLDDIPIDIRIIAATNKDLEKAVEEKTFRADLYYRISVVPITMPPLRRRGNDIILLANFFIEKYNRVFDKRTTLDDSAKKSLLQYKWPGNIRELNNVIERVVLLSKSESIYEKDLPEEIRNLNNRADSDKLQGSASKEIHIDVDENISLTCEVDRIEKEYIKKALLKCGGNQTKAANMLGVSRFTLKRKIEKHEISSS